MTVQIGSRMNRAKVNGAELEYEIRGQGDPILLIHGSHISNSFAPLMIQRPLIDHFSLIRYHRRGFPGSERVHGRFSIRDQAEDARALLDDLGCGPAHVVGHSYGGSIALQLAADHPDRVATLILFEAAVLTVDGGQDVFNLVDVAQALYRKGDWEAAVDLFLGSPKERCDISRNVPGGLEGAIGDVDTYFMVEAPAHQTWEFGDEEGSRLHCPVFFVVGAESQPLYRKVCEQVRLWAPQTESGVLEGASHLLHIQNPAGAAKLIADWCHKHPVIRRVQERSHGGRSNPDPYNATVDILEGNLQAGRAGKVAIRAPARDHTYAELMTAANRAGNALLALGARMEDRVLMVMTDSMEFAATFFGAIKIGAVPVPVTTSASAEEYAFLLDDTRARVAVVSESVARNVREARAEAPYLEHFVVAGMAEAGELSYEAITKAAAEGLRAADTSRDDAAFWLYTLDAAGRSIAVIHAHGAMRACADGYGRHVLKLDPTDTTFSVARLYSSYGLGGGLYLPFAVGATAILADQPPQTRMVLHTLRTYRPSVVFAGPTSYADILDSSRSRKGDEYSSVRLCISAGESLGTALLKRWQAEIGQDIVDGFGSTEACHIYLSNLPGDIRPGSAGRLVDGYEARLVDESFRDVPTGESGRLLLAGDSLFTGYWRHRKLTRAAFHQEWLDTGDLFSVDRDGYYTHLGRLEDRLKVSGMWVSPVEVEAALRETGLVEDCAVFGMQSSTDLVRLVAAIVPTDGSADHEELGAMLRVRVRAKLGSNKTPRFFHCMPALPKDERGKVDRARLPEWVRPLTKV